MVKFPDICELPPKIGSLTLGLETTSSSRVMAISLLLSFAALVVISPQILAPLLSIDKLTTTSPFTGSEVAKARAILSPSKAAAPEFFVLSA